MICANCENYLDNNNHPRNCIDIKCDKITNYFHMTDDHKKERYKELIKYYDSREVYYNGFCWGLKLNKKP
tara:strand:- start:203 stop:412 length:210 start_codon:yes stop_codon:yes gene_type:complete